MTISPSAPLHVCSINGVSFRFFRGAGEAPDMPWHDHEALLAALTLPRPVRRHLRAAMLRHWSEACRTIEVEGDPVLIAPHFVAQGLIGMAQEVGRDVTTIPDQVEREYNLAGVAALGLLTAHLPSVKERAEWALEAFRNQGGAS